MLLALQMLPEVCLLLGPTVAHGAVVLSAGSHAHGQVPGDALPRSGVVIWPWMEERGDGREVESIVRCSFSLSNSWKICHDSWKNTWMCGRRVGQVNVKNFN